MGVSWSPVLTHTHLVSFKRFSPSHEWAVLSHVVLICVWLTSNDVGHVRGSPCRAALLAGMSAGYRIQESDTGYRNYLYLIFFQRGVWFRIRERQQPLASRPPLPCHVTPALAGVRASGPSMSRAPLPLSRHLTCRISADSASCSRPVQPNSAVNTLP